MSITGTYKVKMKTYKIHYRMPRETRSFEKNVDATNKQEALRSLREGLGVIGGRIVPITIVEIASPVGTSSHRDTLSKTL